MAKLRQVNIDQIELFKYFFHVLNYFLIVKKKKIIPLAWNHHLLYSLVWTSSLITHAVVLCEKPLFGKSAKTPFDMEQCLWRGSESLIYVEQDYS